jgi:hypothetical protein
MNYESIKFYAANTRNLKNAITRSIFYQLHMTL